MARWRHTGRLRVADRGPHEAEPYARVGTDDRCATCGDIIERVPVRADPAREALDDGVAVFDQPKAYYDHDGERTADPRCELGLCVECIDADLSAGQVPRVPSLSTHDERYLTDPEYRDRVATALVIAGVRLREASDVS